MPISDFDNPIQLNSATSELTSGQTRDLSTLDILILFANRKWYILKIAFGVGLLTAIVSLLLPFRYTAETVILPPQQNSSASAMFSQLGGLGSLASLMGSGFLHNPNDMYAAMLKSETVENAVVRRFNLTGRYKVKLVSDARKVLDSNVKVKSNSKDGLIRLSVEDRDPQRAADLANGFVQELQNLTAKLAVTEASQRRLFFEQQLVEAKDKLADAEEDLKKTELKTGLIMLDSQGRAVIETVATLRGQIAAKEVQITAMRSFATERNPELIIAQQQLAAWRKQLAAMGGGLNGGGDDLLMPKGQVPAAALEYVRKFREVKYRETVFELLAKQFEIAKLDEAKQGSLVQVVDPALKPDRRSFPKRTLMVLIATFLAFVVSLFLVLFQAHLQDRPEDHRKVQLLKKLFFTRLRPKS